MLVIDDAMVSRMIASAVLSAEGHQCDEAASIPEAISKLRARPYDVLVLDLDFGEDAAGGFDLLDLLGRERRWDAPQALVLTGDQDSQIECLHRGACDYVTKPFEPKILAARVARTLRERARLAALAISSDDAHVELAGAAVAQRAARPRTPIVRGAVAASGAVLMRSTVGGDLFDVVEDGEGRLTALLADVAGHGAAAAFVGSAIRTAARGALEAGAELSAVLDAIQSCLNSYAGVLESSAAVGLARFEPATLTMEIVNAGLPPMVFVREHQSEAIPSMRYALGMGDAPRLRPIVRAATPGASIAMFSDGATRQSMAPEAAIRLARRLGIARFGAALALAPPDMLAKALRDAMAGTSGDDATVLIAGRVLA